MSDEELEKRVLNGINKARSIWFLGMVVAVVVTAFTMPLSSLIWLIPIGFLSYAFTMRLAAVFLAARLSEEEIGKLHAANVRHDELNGTVAPKQEVEITVTASPVDAAGPVVGTYMDKPIYEFIMVKVPAEKEVTKFMYHGPARVVAGVPEIPVFDDMLFACANGILYSKTL